MYTKENKDDRVFGGEIKDYEVPLEVESGRHTEISELCLA